MRWDEDKLYTKVVEFKDIQNFVVDKFLIWDNLRVQIFNKFSNQIWHN